MKDIVAVGEVLIDLTQKGMDELGVGMGLSIRVQREDIFQSMHRI